MASIGGNFMQRTCRIYSEVAERLRRSMRSFVQRRTGERSILFTDFHRLPGSGARRA
jgi:hypothetical protein